MSNDELIFAPENELPTGPSADGLPPWRVLVVDDDEQIHAVTRLNLFRFLFRGRALELTSVYSGQQARQLLLQDQGFALALVDVVMETDSSGLDLIRFVREELGNRAMRLILRTGQAGQAPEQRVMVEYEIDDYKSKTELTADKLFTAVVAALRGFEYITALERLNAELESRVAMRTAELERIALLDALTGVANRRHLDVRADIELAAVRREGSALAVIAFDIDHFKAVNDNFGHAIGDKVLVTVTQTVAQTLRPGDFLARTGGEEFIVLLPDTTVSAACEVAERVRASVAARRVATDAGSGTGAAALSVTASFGVAGLAVQDVALNTVIERADGALYQAKQSGRNRVAVALD